MGANDLIYRPKRLPFPLPLVGRGAGWGSTHLWRRRRLNLVTRAGFQPYSNKRTAKYPPVAASAVTKAPQAVSTTLTIMGQFFRVARLVRS